MGKCIPYVYKKADRKILDIIETEMYINKNGELLPEVWQVGDAICKKNLITDIITYIYWKMIYLMEVS